MSDANTATGYLGPRHNAQSFACGRLLGRFLTKDRAPVVGTIWCDVACQGFAWVPARLGASLTKPPLGISGQRAPLYGRDYTGTTTNGNGTNSLTMLAIYSVAVTLIIKTESTNDVADTYIGPTTLLRFLRSRCSVECRRGQDAGTDAIV